VQTDRRKFLLAVLLTPALRREAWSAEGSPARVRGKLDQATDRQPGIFKPDGQRVALEGDQPSEAVLRDVRRAGVDFEADGRYLDQARFRVDPIYRRALHVWKDGRRLVVTYWCEVCAIRAWSPGPCACCQNETQLDLRDPDLEDIGPAK
jgi:hypothetical protein